MAIYYTPGPVRDEETDAIKARLDVDEANIQNHETRISKNETKIQSVETELASQDMRIEALEEGGGGGTVYNYTGTKTVNTVRNTLRNLFYKLKFSKDEVSTDVNILLATIIPDNACEIDYTGTIFDETVGNIKYSVSAYGGAGTNPTYNFAVKLKFDETFTLVSDTITFEPKNNAFSQFTPETTGTENQVLTKTATGYDWKDAQGGGGGESTQVYEYTIDYTISAAPSSGTHHYLVGFGVDGEAGNDYALNFIVVSNGSNYFGTGYNQGENGTFAVGSMSGYENTCAFKITTNSNTRAFTSGVRLCLQRI